jgi:hypothetical protein
MKDTQVGMGLGTSVGREPGSSDFGLILSAHPPHHGYQTILSPRDQEKIHQPSYYENERCVLR